MKLYAKILHRYFEQIKNERKRLDFRQFEDLTYLDTETGEEITLTIVAVDRCASRSAVLVRYPDVKWDPNNEIYAISLGRKL